MPGRSGGGERVASAISTTSLTTLKPRQVLLALNRSMKRNDGSRTTTHTPDDSQTAALTSDCKTMLLHSICQYLDRNGFSKALKKLRSEAQIENDNWKSCILNLEDMYKDYLKNRCTTAGDAKKMQGQGRATEVVVLEVGGTCSNSSIENASKKTKKKKDNKSDERKAGAASEKAELVEKSRDVHQHADNVKVKSKEEKVGKVSDDSHVQITAEKAGEESSDVLTGAPRKSKDKKKQSELSLESPNNAQQQLRESVQGESKGKKHKKNKKLHSSDECVKEPIAEEQTEDKICSKKRKKLSSEEHQNGHDELLPKGSKRRKTGHSDDVNAGELPAKVPVSSLANGEVVKGENGRVKSSTLQTPSKEKEAGFLATEGEDKSSMRNRDRREHTGSPQPRTLSAFQRVKADHVVFADDKLKDNSYWAKDGADSGYGAKAQEVLGQVRGRDFRHEKTKKKRGSYRGGQIDLYSHSVKFNYSDED